MMTAWIYVPISILIILLACFGVESLIGLSSVSFPASVACMIILFFALIICESLFGDRKTKRVVNLVEIPGGFALRYINILFSPSFILLPSSSPIGGIEIAKIIGVFVIGYFAMAAFTAYLVRGLQYILGTSKRAMTERAEELGTRGEDIPLTHSRHPSEPATEPSSAPLRAQDPSQITGTGGPPEASPTLLQESNSALRQDPIPLTRAQKWAAFINVNLDTLSYIAIFVFIGVPIYYSTSYAMPIQLSFNILAYFVALTLPAKWRRFLHPVLVSSLITVLGVWIFALIRGDSLRYALYAYKTGTKYTQLWQGKPSLPRPGAGDLFSTVLDVSIVALALPMFQYRHELRRHFLPILLPNTLLALASLFSYPTLCHALSIAPTRSLSFASRSLTLALAQPATANLGGDLSLVAVLCIVSGILGVLLGHAMLRIMRITDDDYITRGVTLGANSSAMATALLLASDPRAAAFSCLSMSLFGTVTVALTSVPVVVRVVARLAGVEG
ncbi:uncharacterized protein BDZ99DRAFT_424137 [Mytilinidion resinicola]|uniref:LrgB-domain-containing protein n=1 Tax=Mytilinidion resinicola TaxID=574789 RepID=A0A6A6YAA8_9PEZI|nr:uncharacterized protein BDZ99DRAFT_424137 [Mytilinidion resinicola]KAF2805746.1 hypothetical protein BDZ99DRAFT_424137 [Mytilinidion resinicola]